MWLFSQDLLNNMAATVYRKAQSQDTNLLCVPSLRTVFKSAWPPEKCCLNATSFASHFLYESGLLRVIKGFHFTAVNRSAGASVHRILRVYLRFADCSTLGRVKGRCQRSWRWYRSRNLLQLQPCSAWCVLSSHQLQNIMTVFSHINC